jgi:hypothetical protein
MPHFSEWHVERNHPLLRAAWIIAGLTEVGSGAAALSGSEKTTPAASTVDVLSTSRLENFLSRTAFAPLIAVVRGWALVYARQCSMQPSEVTKAMFLCGGEARP